MHETEVNKKMKVGSLIVLVFIVAVTYSLATMISNEYEQYTAIAYFMAGMLSRAIPLAVDYSNFKDA